METEDKQELSVISQKRKHREQNIQTVRNHKKQEAKKQLALKDYNLMGIEFRTVLTKKCMSFISKAHRKHHLVVNYYHNNDYKVAKKLLKLNLIKILRVKNHQMVLTDTKLGKVLYSKTFNGHMFWKWICVSLTSIFNLAMLTNDIRCMAEVASSNMGTSLNGLGESMLSTAILATGLILTCICVSNEPMTNVKALKALKGLLKPYQYRQEYKIFKYYALND